MACLAGCRMCDRVRVGPDTRRGKAMDKLQTRRTVISTVTRRDAPALQDYYQRNMAHLARFEPSRPTGYHSLRAWRRRAGAMSAASRAGTGWHLVARLRDQDRLLAICNFNAVIRGVLQACQLGYSIDAAREGQGFMQEILTAALDAAFAQLGLHRVVAAYMPENERSGRLLARLGFETEGLARSYLLINGAWRDHILTSKINPADILSGGPA